MAIPGKLTPRIILENAAVNKTPVLDSSDFIPLPGYVNWETSERATKIVYKVLEPQVKGVCSVVSGRNLSFEYHSEDSDYKCLAEGYHIKLDPWWVANRALRTIFIGVDQGMCITGIVLHELGHIKHTVLSDGGLWTKEERAREPIDKYYKGLSLAEEGRVEKLICHKHKYAHIYISANLYSWAETRLQSKGDYSLGDMYPFLYGRLNDKKLLLDFRNLYISYGGEPKEMEKILSEYHKIKNFNTTPVNRNSQRTKAKKLLVELADWMDSANFKTDDKFRESHKSLEKQESSASDGGSSYGEGEKETEYFDKNISKKLSKPEDLSKKMAEIMRDNNYQMTILKPEKNYAGFNAGNIDEVSFLPTSGDAKSTGVAAYTILEQIRNYYMKDINVSSPLALNKDKEPYTKSIETIMTSPIKQENYTVIANIRGQEEFIVRMEKVMKEAEYKISSFLNDRLIINERKKDGRFSIPSVMPSVMHTGGLDGKWYEQRHHAGKGHGNIEIVVGLDVSGSMAEHFGPMAVLSRMLKRSFDSLGFSTNILIWDTEAHRVYGKHDRVFAESEVPDISDHVGGGTDPNCCGALARSIFAESTRDRRFYVIMTDGGWHREDRHISDMKAYPDFWSLLVYYSHGATGDDKFRGYNQYVELDNMQQLGQAIVDFVEEGVSQTAASLA